MQFVGDEDDCLARVLEGLDDLEEVGDFLRGQHRGRFVEDQHIGRTEQNLDDLDALLDADGQVLDQCVGVDFEAVGLVDFPDLGAGFLEIEQIDRAGRLDTEHDVFGDREDGNKHEMLMHHADAGADRIARTVEMHGLAVYEDLAFIGPVKTREHVHQGGFAGAVFAQKPEDLASLDVEVYARICNDLTKALGYAAELDIQRALL